MEIVHLDARTRALLMGSLGRPGVIPQNHPIWIDILGTLGDDCGALLAMDHEELLGWIPYAVRRGSHGAVVNSLPLVAYGGPAGCAGDEATAAALLEALRGFASSVSADVLTVATSPFLSEAAEATYRKVLAPTHEFENFVQVQELRPHPLEQLSGKSKVTMRSKVRRARSHGLRVVSALTSDQLEDWLAIYHARYVDLGARPYPDAFHREAFERAVPAGAAEFWGVVDVDGQTLVGGVMFLTSGAVTDYFSSAFLSSHNHLNPATLLLHDAFTTFAARGVRWFNWQSSPGRGGVYEYKARWGAREARHAYLCVLFNQRSKLFDLDIPAMQEAYPLRFVLPYTAWPPRTETGVRLV